MDWKENAISTLLDSLLPVPSELNELDWKSGLSCKTERLAQHICAFANNKGGGMFVFGVHNDGTCFSVEKKDIEAIVQTLGNIAHNNLSYSIQIEHSLVEYNGASLLFVYVPEQKDKPVSLRGKDIFDSYCRSAGQTVKMSRNQVKAMLAVSQGITFEQMIAKKGLSVPEVLSLLNYKKFYTLLDKNIPSSSDTILDRLSEFGACVFTGGKWDITNLGAILFANDLNDFPTLSNKPVIVRKYRGTNNRDMLSDLKDWSTISSKILHLKISKLFEKVYLPILVLQFVNL